MSRPSPRCVRRWTAVLLGVACVALLPALLALLAPPPFESQGPVFDVATREGCTAALDRVERLLAGALDVELLDATFSGLLMPRGLEGLGVRRAQPVARLALVARPSETERTL